MSADEKGISISKSQFGIRNVNELLDFSSEHRDIEMMDGGSDSEKLSGRSIIGLQNSDPVISR
jgi:hypothetical protein